MGRHVAGHRQASALARRMSASARGRRDVRQVQPGPGHVADARRRGARGRARRRRDSAATGQPRKPEDRGHEAVVRLGALGQGRHPRRGRRSADRAPRRRQGRTRGAPPTGSGRRRRRTRPPRHPRAHRARPACSPARPAVTAPCASSSTGEPDAAAAARIRARTPARRAPASVFGIAQTVVNPPWAAAASPVATVSASSLPGSRRCAWRSMKPGATTTPPAVDARRPRRRTARSRPRGSRRGPRSRPGLRGPWPGRPARRG